MTGGYSLIDCFDVNITSDPVKIEGIFKKYQMSKRKAFLLSNVTINNTQLNDVFSTPYFEDGKVCFPAYDGVIKISDTDYVTFEATADVIADKYLSKEDFLTIESDNIPYVSRTARDGLVKIPQLVGGTVAWNQLVDSDTESVTIPTGRKYILYHDGIYTLGTSDGTAVAVSSGDMFFDITIMFGTTVANAMTTTLFATMFPKTDYAYDAGSLQSVCTSGRKITALDGTVRTYPIDNEELRGLFKLDANNKLYADGDIYPPSGSGTRKYGLLTEQSGAIGDTISLTGAKEDTTNITSTKGALSDIGTISGTTLTLTVALSDDSILYELAEPTTFSADSYINPQRSEGTEEFVDGLTRDVMIPVGNESTYYLSEVLPSAADYTDGQVAGLESSLADTDNMIAPAWSATETYTKNTIVRDGGQLYKAKSDVPIGTATSNTAYWENITLASNYSYLENIANVNKQYTSIDSFSSDVFKLQVSQSIICVFSGELTKSIFGDSMATSQVIASKIDNTAIDITAFVGNRQFICKGRYYSNGGWVNRYIFTGTAYNPS